MNASDYRAGLMGIILLVLASNLHPTQASGEILVYEGFDYSSGASLNTLGWEGFRWGTNRWSQLYADSDWKVFPSGLQFGTLPGTGGGIRETNLTKGADYQRLFDPYYLGDSQSLWFSFLIRVTQGTSWNVYISSASNASKIGVEGGYGDYELHARIGVGDNGSTNKFTVGQNQTRLIVGRYTYHAGANEELDVWLDSNLSTEPISGGLSTGTHIVYAKELTADPDRRDRLLISSRSIGALELDEFRVGTTWSNVVSRVIDTPVIKSLVLANDAIHLSIERLTIGVTNHIETTSSLTGQPTWESVASFISVATTTNFSLTGGATNNQIFLRLQSLK